MLGRRIISVTVYLDWLDQLNNTSSAAKEFPNPEIVEQRKFENTFVFEEEADLLKTFLDIIEDADVLSGWNSEGFDIPYTVHRDCQSVKQE